MSQDKAATQPDSEVPKNENDSASPDNSASAAEVEAGLEAENVAEDVADVTEVGDEISDSEPADEVSLLKAQFESASAKADENMDLALRTRAEMENLRKRQARELENAHKYALDKMAAELLPVRDTLELGVAAAGEEQADLSKVVEGTELTLKMLTQALEKFNIVEVNPVGEKFDPDLHQAISMQEGTDQPANTVLTVMQKGYTLNDRLLRPAMVIIAK